MRGRGRGAPRGSRYPSRWSWRTSSLEWRNSTARSTMDANCIGTTSCPMEWSVPHLPFSHLFVALFYDFCFTGSFYGAFLAIFLFCGGSVFYLSYASLTAAVFSWLATFIVTEILVFSPPSPSLQIVFQNQTGRYDLEVTTYQMAVLFTWNQRPEDSISFESLR